MQNLSVETKPHGTGAIRSLLFDSPGYSLDFGLSGPEVARIAAMIRAQYLQRLALFATAETMAVIETTPLQRYHEIAHLIDHKAAWPKVERLLPDENVREIRSFGFVQALEEVFGPFDISNEEGIRSEEMYWRIVRPHAPGDVGPIHADRWFWELGHGKTPAGKERVKVWIPVISERDRSGLLLYPETHKRSDWEYTGAERDGFIKPDIKCDLSGHSHILFSGENGRIVVFNDSLLHGGMPNQGSQTRFSLEFTMFIDRERACLSVRS